MKVEQEYKDSLLEIPQYKVISDKIKNFIPILPIPLKYFFRKDVLLVSVGSNSYSIPINENIHPSEYCQIIEICFNSYFPSFYREEELSPQEISKIIKRKNIEIESILNEKKKVLHVIQKVNIKKDRIKIRNTETNLTTLYLTKIPTSVFLKNIRKLKKEETSSYIEKYIKKIEELKEKKISPTLKNHTKSQVINFIIINYLNIKNFDLDLSNSALKQTLSYCEKNIKSEKDILIYYGVKNYGTANINKEN